jgi:polyhydroxyalkanoate synthesis regulator phasin
MTGQTDGLSHRSIPVMIQGPASHSRCTVNSPVAGLITIFSYRFLKKETPMFDLVRKSMLAGVGLALKAWDEVEDLAKEVAEQSKMTEKEGRKFIDEIQDRYDDAQKKLEERVEKSVKNLLKKADVVTQDELKGLKKEIRDLKTLISSQGGEEKP